MNDFHKMEKKTHKTKQNPQNGLRKLNAGTG